MIELLLCAFTDVKRVLKKEKSTSLHYVFANHRYLIPSFLYKHSIICHCLTNVYECNVYSVEFYPSNLAS